MIAKEQFKNRLKKAMQIRNIKAVELVEKTGISKVNISCYISGKYEAKADGLKLLADALDVDPVWLMGYDVPMEKNYTKNEFSAINIINLLTNEVVEKIPYSYRTDIEDDKPENFFAIYATDNSMAPLLDVGDIAIIRKYKDFINQRTYLLKIKNGQPIIRKVIKSDNGDIELQALNMWNFPTQTNLHFEDIEILGEVIKVENKSAFK